MTEVITDDHILLYLQDMDKKYRSGDIVPQRFRAKDEEDLLRRFLLLRERVSENAYLDNTIALIYVTGGQPEEAIELLENAVRLAPENKFYHANLAIAYYQVGRVEEAKQCLRQSKIVSFEEWNWQKDYEDFTINEDLIRKEYAELFPEEVEAELRALEQQAHQYYEQGQYVYAIDYFTTVLDVQPENHEVLNNIGACHLHLQDFKEANKFFTKALAIDPTAHGVLLNFVLLFMITKKYELAVGVLKKAHSAYPDDALFLYYLACAYAHLKHDEKAVKYLKLCLDIAPEYYLEVDQERVFHPILKHLEV